MSEGESERTRRFDALFESYSSDIVAYCSWRAASASDAQDAVSEVFLTAWRRLDALPGGDDGTDLAVRHRAEGLREPEAVEPPTGSPPGAARA